MMTVRHCLLATTIACALYSPQGALADSSVAQLQEIVVTAQKHHQNFNDVGISGSVISSKEIAAQGLRRLNDIASQTPNVQIKDVVANSIPNVTIRGIGLNDYAANNNPAAGIYVDNVYLVSPAMLSFGLFDLERIEVLKGPQGELYGRNTTAGAVDFISRKPSDVTDVEMQAGVGNYDSWHFDGAAGGRISRTLSGRLALQTVQQESGWQTNYLTGRRVGKVHRTAARLQLDWRPNDALNVLWNLHGGYDGSDVDLIKVANVTTTLGSQYANDPYVSGASDNPHMMLTSVGSSVTADWAFAKRLTLTSISAYEHFTRLHVEDRDGTILKQLDGTFNNHIDQYSEELRLRYLGPDLVLIGGLYYSQDLVQDIDSYASSDLLSLLGLVGFQTIGNQYRQRSESEAAYLHSEWTFLPRWTLVTGARFTHDNKRFDRATTFLVSGGVSADVFAPVSKQYSSHNVSGKVGLDYKLLEHTLLYANVSRGYKSGGFQGQLAFDPSVLEPFKDETVLAYELGLKSRTLANTLQLDAALFDYEYHSAQFYGPLFNSPLGVLFGITNVGNARVQGGEADASWLATPRLEFRLGIGALHTRIVKSVVPGVTTGSQLPNAPKVTYDGSVRYHWPVGEALQADVMLWVNYQGKLAFDVVRNPPQALEGGYFLGNAELGLGTDDGHWRIWLWGKNLFDRLYKTQALFSSVGWGYSYGPPRTYGIDVSWKR